MSFSVLTECAGITREAPVKSEEILYPPQNNLLSLDLWNLSKSYGIRNIQEQKEYLLVAVVE